MAEPSWSNALEALADNKFVLGDQLVDVGISAPELASALAAVAMAQGELGHARHLYHWSHELQGISKEIRAESGKALSVLRHHENWIELMVSLLAVNVAARVLLERLRQLNEAMVVSKTAKMLVEMAEHITFAGEWCRRFRAETGAIPGLFQAALSRQSDAICAWLRAVDAEIGGGSDMDMANAFVREMEMVCGPVTVRHPA
ncbi:hypothetical protein GCM10025857_27180 [Alicyclobacillus contaminans]|uniref:Phenylacetic acid catabolic protein n=1 Tax=Alicyclobacillus contaminans TaxID=392016 RepID=UPI0003F579B4|nr:Phenylacetic acid catabolic protein [Alicyclobacillus contaminans]GMA51361.1 hypothetical protein GCM10025857_27180 [Alicyclobacillus contaminans]